MADPAFLADGNAGMVDGRHLGDNPHSARPTPAGRRSTPSSITAVGLKGLGDPSPLFQQLDKVVSLKSVWQRMQSVPPCNANFDKLMLRPQCLKDRLFVCFLSAKPILHAQAGQRYSLSRGFQKVRSLWRADARKPNNRPRPVWT